MLSSSQSEVECQVITVLIECYSVGRRKVEVDSRLIEDLYIDSMGLVEIVLELNEVFGVELSKDEVEKWRVVGDICSSIARCVRL